MSKLVAENERLRRINYELVQSIGKALLILRDRAGDALAARTILATALQLAANDGIEKAADEGDQSHGIN